MSFDCDVNFTDFQAVTIGRKGCQAVAAALTVNGVVEKQQRAGERHELRQAGH